MSDAPGDDSPWRRWEAPTVGARRDPPPKSADKKKSQRDEEQKRAGEQSSSGGKKQPVTAAEIESIQEAAYREAHDKGYQEGLKAGEDKVRQQAREIAGVIDALSEPLAAIDRAVEEEISDLVCLIARQLIRRELRTDPGQIVAVVREAVRVLPSSDRQVRVQLHPEDAALIREVAGGSSHDARWELIEDPGLNRGGCVVSDRNSRVDMRLEQQIGRVMSAMLGEEREAPEAAIGPDSGLDDSGLPTASGLQEEMPETKQTAGADQTDGLADAEDSVQKSPQQPSEQAEPSGQPQREDRSDEY